MFNEGVKLLFHRKIFVSYISRIPFRFLGEIADLLAEAATGTAVDFLDFEEIIDKPRTIRSLKALHIRQSQFQSLLNKKRIEKVSTAESIILSSIILMCFSSDQRFV